MITINLPNVNNIIIGKKLQFKQLSSGIIFNCNSLNKDSEASKFFGVDSRQNVQQKMENHINLALLKGRELGILPSFPKRAFFSVDRPKTLINAWNHIWTICKGRKFDQLLTNPARLTFDGKFFGENGIEDSHTIGILYEPKSKTLFCLDSLSNLCKQVRAYQYILKKQIFNSPNGEIRKIIFSSKHQQNINEYTCNNWAIANIEALQKAIACGKTIDSTSKLNNILPDNINDILQEQYEYILKNNSQ